MLYTDEKLGLWVPIALLLFAAINFAVPSGFWFRVDRLDVRDGVYGQPIIADYEREIVRPFTADWRIKIRRASGDGLEWVCASPLQREDYDDRSRKPQPVTLEWLAWTDPRCYELTPGDYVITVTWELNPDGLQSLFLRRTVSVTDSFTIEAAL